MATTPDPSSPDANSFPAGPEPGGDAPTAAASLLLFRRYRVLRELGRGGMGVVLLAHDTALDIPVAVKLVPDLVVHDTEAMADLRKEVLRGMALAHPGIVRTHNFEKDETGAGIVMEYVEGENLTELKVRQPGGCFEPDQILPWLEQLVAVLDHAHRDARIVHRDLKPRNLMLTKTGRIKVADFGIAAVLSDTASRHSMEGKVSGTLSYMSPQQAEGGKPTPLDDIHALGATLYDLLTGKPPYFRGNPATILAQILTVTPPSMTARRADLEVTGRPALPSVWEETIAACLAKDPADRPQSAGEVLRRLQTPAAREAAPPIATPVFTTPEVPPPGEEDDATLYDSTHPAPALVPTRPVRRSPSQQRPRRWLTWAAVVCVPLAAIFATVHFLQAPRPRPVAAVAPAATPPESPIVSTSMPRAESEQVEPGQPDTPEVAVTIRQYTASAPPMAVPPLATPPATPASLPYPIPTVPPTPTSIPKAAPTGIGPPPATTLIQPTPTSRPTTPTPRPIDPVAAATQDKPFINSLGQEFVPVPGTPVLLCRWETRVKDYLAFTAATGRAWDKPSYMQTEAHPVTFVSWEDANAFCAWLSKKEGRTYRLPTDLEWSAAVGLPAERGTTPAERDSKIKGVYPWGTQFPPPLDAGNYAREEVHYPGTLEGNDGFEFTAPVGRFPANAFGLCDLGGNVAEWCEDRYSPDKDRRVLRGSSFMEFDSDKSFLLASYRKYSAPDNQSGDDGFRIVLDPAAAKR